MSGWWKDGLTKDQRETLLLVVGIVILFAFAGATILTGKDLLSPTWAGVLGILLAGGVLVKAARKEDDDGDPAPRRATRSTTERETDGPSDLGDGGPSHLRRVHGAWLHPC